MRVAFPLFGSRVSPRCTSAREMILVTLDGGEVAASERMRLAARDDDDFLDRLLELHVDRLVCGGIRRDLAALLRTNGVEVTYNVAGEVDEVLKALRAGRLRTGFGLEGVARPPVRIAALKPASAVVAPAELPAVDCVACRDRSCLKRSGCPLYSPGAAEVPLPARDERIFEVGRDISAENDPKLCRIAELVHFAKGMGYRRIGLAFCWELFRETETLERVLSRFFEVVPVCCRVGTPAPVGRSGRFGEAPPCNPVLQAQLLEREGTDLNVAAGLCMGSDILFAAESHAPVTTLFVKDRTLAHNPVGAIYTRYHLELLERERGGAGPDRRARR